MVLFHNAGNKEWADTRWTKDSDPKTLDSKRGTVCFDTDCI